MKELVTTCDHCGKKLDDMKDFPDMEFDTSKWVTTDLCADCYAELSKIIEQFCNRSK